MTFSLKYEMRLLETVSGRLNATVSCATPILFVIGEQDEDEEE